ncbi:MAG: FemAB family XrtA/PEP-CTERM system-associated protein [Alphaproteobacteria bacterium]
MTADATKDLRVRELDASSEAAWDAFVESCAGATFFHRAGWKRVIEASFGHRCPFLFAERDGEIRGVLPLVDIRSRLFGHALISSGFAVYGGVAARDEEAHVALEASALALADELDADHLEMRGRVPAHPGWQCRSDLYVTFRKALDPDPEKNLLAVPRKQRAMVRKGIKEGLASTIDADVDRLHRIYAVSVRNLGTPVFPKRYFRNLHQEFGEDCEILTVTAGQETIASVMSFRFRDEVLPYYGGGTTRARGLAGNDFMYWEVMRRAVARGCRVFDFGRSKQGTGSFAFKKNWGFVPEPLHYAYYLRKGGDVPDVNPLNPKYRLFIAAWKRLPLPVANLIGPFIARSLG